MSHLCEHKNISTKPVFGDNTILFAQIIPEFLLQTRSLLKRAQCTLLLREYHIQYVSSITHWKNCSYEELSNICD